MTTTSAPGVPTREAVRLALIELLVPGEHPVAATDATLAAVASTRRDLAALHGPHDPAARYIPERDRHAALSCALGDIGKALLATRYHHRRTDPWRLRAGLTVLASVALAWLDTLPHNPEDPEDAESDDGPDAEPF